MQYICNANAYCGVHYGLESICLSGGVISSAEWTESVLGLSYMVIQVSFIVG